MIARRAGYDADVIVAGAGPAGAGFAAKLAAAGHDVLLVEREQFPRDKVCGDFVGPLALVELEALGVTRNPAFARTNRVREAALYVDGEHLITFPLPQVDGAPAEGRVVPRALLDGWIVDAARRAGARLFEGYTVAGYEAERDAVVVVVRRGGVETRLRARLLVGADGSASAVARTLRGSGHPKSDTLIAVRAYYDGVAGPDDRCDLYFSRDSFPGYYWLFPTGGGAANLGVGMLVETVPPPDAHLRDLLLDLARRDPSLGVRIRNATQRGKIVGWPLACYNPRLPVTGERVLLLGDAAGFINPINGEGIQYALCSASWAAETALAALREGDLGAARLHAYAERAATELRYDMALSRLIVHSVANRTLNDVWLGVLRGLVGRAGRDPRYGHVTGGILAGLVPARDVLEPRMLAASVEAVADLAAERALRTALGGPLEVARAGAGAVGGALRATAAMLDNAPATMRWLGTCADGGMDLVAEVVRARLPAQRAAPGELRIQSRWGSASLRSDATQPR